MRRLLRTVAVEEVRQREGEVDVAPEGGRRREGGMAKSLIVGKELTKLRYTQNSLQFLSMYLYFES
jgi:hypothetical protein